jgi:hypothetical protein
MFIIALLPQTVLLTNTQPYRIKFMIFPPIGMHCQKYHWFALYTHTSLGVYSFISKRERFVNGVVRVRPVPKKHHNRWTAAVSQKRLFAIR